MQGNKEVDAKRAQTGVLPPEYSSMSLTFMTDRLPSETSASPRMTKTDPDKKLLEAAAVIVDTPPGLQVTITVIPVVVTCDEGLFGHYGLPQQQFLDTSPPPLIQHTASLAAPGRKYTLTSCCAESSSAYSEGARHTPVCLLCFLVSSRMMKPDKTG